jgi:myo-inositol-1(or 4)-monophosphatase
MRKYFGNGTRVASRLKDDRTHVTQADLEVNAMIIKRVRARFPNISIYGEEESSRIENAELQLLVDPVDGTFPYAHGCPISAFCMALCFRRTPIQAVIYDPFCNRMYSAAKGHGAYLNGNAMRVSEQPNIAGSELVMLWWAGSQWNVDRMERVVTASGGKWINPVSIAYFVGLVAAGQFDGTIFPGTTPLETAAAKVIIEEAGGIVTDMFGEEQDLSGPAIRGHIAANPLLHEKLVALAKEVNAHT